MPLNIIYLYMSELKWFIYLNFCIFLSCFHFNLLYRIQYLLIILPSPISSQNLIVYHQLVSSVGWSVELIILGLWVQVHPMTKPVGLIERAMGPPPVSIAATTCFGTPSVMYANDGCMTPDCSTIGTG